MNVLIVGAGMAGLSFGILALQKGHKVTLVERNNRVGKKIAMTGNGKCNIGNANVNASCFNNSKIAQHVLQQVPVDKYLQFLNQCGIYVFDDGSGRLYPLSESASNVVDCFRHQFAKLGGTLLLETTVDSFTQKNGKNVVKISQKEHVFDKIVVACGSGSQCATPNYSPFVDKKYFTKLVPSLVPVKVKNADVTLNGIRHKCNVTLLDDDTIVGTESGEVLFKDYGLSGICIFNLSALIARSIVEGKNQNFTFSVDLVPKMDEQTLTSILQQRLTSGEKDKLFYGILHNKLAESVVKHTKTPTSATSLCQTAKRFCFTFDKLLDWSMSQVTAGGIDQKHVSLPTLLLPNGVIALGEMLNVDGVCGGNNLYFACASAICAAENL